MPKKIYLACPYSVKGDYDPWVIAEIKEQRFRAANETAADLMAEGHIVFSPISHSHPIAVQCGLPGDWEFWKNFDEAFIAWADEVHVLCIEGWEKSAGIDAELRIARDLGKTIVMIERG